MKNLYKTLALAALAATTLVACNKEPQPVEEPVSPTVGTARIEFTTKVADPSTKATLTPNEGETAFEAAWEGGSNADKIRLNASSPGYLDQTQISTWDDGNKVFTTDAFDLSKTGTGPYNWTYKAYYPAGNPEDPTDASISFGSDREQNGNAYNSQYDVMYGEVTYDNSLFGQSDTGGKLVIPMNRLTGIAYFHITGGPAGEKVVSATLEAENIAAETVSVVDGALSVPETKLNEINLTINGDLSAEDFALWFNVLPGSYPTLKLTITTNSGKTASINASNLTYTAGKLNKAVLSNLNWKNNSEFASYSIVFIDKTNKTPTLISNSTGATTFIEEESCQYVTTNPVPENGATFAYYGGIESGLPLRLGKSSDAGSIILTLSNSGTVCANTITIKAKQYTSGKNKMIGVNGSAKQKPGDDYTDLTFKFDGSTISSIKLDTDGYLYVKSITVTYIEKESVTLSFGETTEFVITSGDEFTPPSLSSNPSGLTVSYSSSNTDVATVDEHTGALTIIGLGSTTVTASFAGDNTYNAASASYTLRVNRAMYTSIAQIKNDIGGSNNTFTATLTNAVVTRKFSDYIAYLQDDTAGILVISAADLSEGDSYTGVVSGEIGKSNNQPRISDIDVSEATKTTGATKTPVEVTIGTLIDNMSDYDGMLCKIVKAKAGANLATGTNKSITINQGASSMTLFTRVSFETGTVAADHYYSITGFPCLYNTTNEIVVVSTDDVEEESITWQLASIAIKTKPTKITYQVGDYFDPTGLVLSTTMEDSTDPSVTKVGDDVVYSSNNASSFSFIPGLSTGLTLANTSVSITYGGKTVSQAITVNEGGEQTYTSTFTNKDWGSDGDYSWTKGKAGAGFSNNGIQVTTTVSGANGTTVKSFNSISKVVVTYNTNKTAGEGTLVLKIGDNETVSKEWAYSGSSSDGRVANYTCVFDFEQAQSGKIKLTANTTTNSIYIVSVAVTAKGIE